MLFRRQHLDHLLERSAVDLGDFFHHLFRLGALEILDGLGAFLDRCSAQVTEHQRLVLGDLEFDKRGVRHQSHRSQSLAQKLANSLGLLVGQDVGQALRRGLEHVLGLLSAESLASRIFQDLGLFLDKFVNLLYLLVPLSGPVT